MDSHDDTCLGCLQLINKKDKFDRVDGADAIFKGRDQELGRDFCSVRRTTPRAAPLHPIHAPRHSTNRNRSTRGAGRRALLRTQVVAIAIKNAASARDAEGAVGLAANLTGKRGSMAPAAAAPAQ